MDMLMLLVMMVILMTLPTTKMATLVAHGVGSHHYLPVGLRGRRRPQGRGLRRRAAVGSERGWRRRTLFEPVLRK